MHNTRLVSLTAPVVRIEKGTCNTIRANMNQELQMSQPSYSLRVPFPRFRGKGKKEEVR